MLQERENQISQRKCFGGAAQFDHLNVKLTFLLLKCQFTQAKLSRSWLLSLAPVHVFTQLFQCQRSVVRFILATFYTRRT